MPNRARRFVPSSIINSSTAVTSAPSASAIHVAVTSSHAAGIPSTGSDRGDGGHRRTHGAGEAEGWRGEQESAAVVVTQPGGQLVEVPQLAKRNAEAEQAEVVDRQEGMPARVAVLAEQALDCV